MSTGSSDAKTHQPESTIAPYYTGLNGVDLKTNTLCRDLLWWTLGGLALLVLTLRILERIWNHMRQSSVKLGALAKQQNWKAPRWSWTPAIKKHIIYAPLGKMRHHREYSAWSLNFGILPCRLHTILIALYAASNVAYLCILKRDSPNKYAVFAELRGRAGTLSVANMVPLIIFAGRNNPLVLLLRLSFDTYNLFHRWIGRIAVVEIMIHAVAWLIPVLADGGVANAREQVHGSLFIASGMTGALSMAIILILSISPIRHAFYETFLNLHMALAAIIFACAWIHCASSTVKGGLPQLPWIMAIVSLWVADRMARFARTLYINWSGKATSTAFCEAMTGEVTRVTVHLPRHFSIQPGTHAYLRFWGLRCWESHPFSIAWVDHHDGDARLPVSERKPSSSSEDDRGRATTTSASFIIAAHTGLTRQLFTKAGSCSQGVYIKASLEGAYAGYHSLDSYGHVVLIAGAAGITHHISYLRPLLEGRNANVIATRRVTVLWIIRTPESLEWVRPHLDALRRVPRCEEFIRFKVHVTRRRKPGVIEAAYDAVPMVEMHSGRPNVPQLLAEEHGEQIGAMCVGVCGPGSLADDVRHAVRAVQKTASITDFIEESFSW